VDFKNIFKNIIASMFLAWLWLFLFILHFIFFSDQEPTNSLLKIFDKIIFWSCFLIYPYALPFSEPAFFWPFFLQFLFWWIFGLVMFKLYQKLSK